jgi:hypothetical protein
MRTDGQTYMTRLTGAFRDCANAFKNCTRMPSTVSPKSGDCVVRVPTAVPAQTTAVCDVTPCILLDKHGRFRGTCYHHALYVIKNVRRTQGVLICLWPEFMTTRFVASVFTTHSVQAHDVPVACLLSLKTADSEGAAGTLSQPRSTR